MAKTHFRATAILTALLLVGCGADSLPPAGGPVSADGGVFSVVGFAPEGRVPRDGTLVVTFSEPVDAASLRAGAVRVVQTGGQEQPVEARVSGDELVLEPPVPFGFAAATRYALIVEGFPSLLALRSRAGRPLAARERIEFTTSDLYGSDLEPPGVDGIELETDPAGTWSVHVRFSETVDPDSVVPGRSLVVTDADSGMALPGRVISDRLGVWYRFLPGESPRPAAIRVVLTAGITDLAGNPLSPHRAPLEARFELPVAADPARAGEIAEDFTDDRMMDSARTTALWNGDRFPGVLLAEPATTLLPLPGDPDQPESFVDIGGEPVRIRLLLTREELGVARELTGLEWSPAGGAFLPAEYESLEIEVTPTTRETLDGEGFELDRPTRLLRRTPWRIEAGEWERARVAFSESYLFDGSSNLLLEIRVGRGDHTNFLRGHHSPTGRALVEAGAETVAVRPVLTLRSFSWSPVATSRFYDSGLEDPVYLAPVIQPEDLPDGVRMRIAFQGARRLGADGRPPVDDPAAASDWTPDVRDLAGYRFVRFRIEFEGVSLSGAAAAIDDIVIPFRRGR